MALSPGTRLGPYEVVSAIGSGGMGEVYRARDTKLNRDVAVKVLPASVAGDPERLARFRREAQVLASLNHPNIAHIHGLEDTASAPALVMALVDGPALARRRSWQLLAVSLAQGLLGYTQYFTGLPEILVGLHLLGACLVWLFTLRLVCALSTRDGGAGDEPASDPATAVAA